MEKGEAKLNQHKHPDRNRKTYRRLSKLLKPLLSANSEFQRLVKLSGFVCFLLPVG